MLADSLPHSAGCFLRHTEQTVNPVYALGKTLRWFDNDDVRELALQDEVWAKELVYHEASLLDGGYNHIMLMGISRNLNLPTGVGMSVIVGFFR